MINLYVDIPVIAVSVTTAVTTVLYDSSYSRTQYSVSSKNDLNPLDRTVVGNDRHGFRIAGDIGTAVIPVAALCLSIIEYPSLGWYGVIEDFIIIGEAMAVSSLVQRIVCTVFPRQRPYMYDPRLKIEYERNNGWDIRSFYSGHTTTCFTATTAFAYVFMVRNPRSPLVPVIWTAGILSSTFVAVARPLAGQHFWTDIIAGSIAGTAMGILIPALHLSSLHNGAGEVHIVFTGNCLAASCAF